MSCSFDNFLQQIVPSVLKELYLKFKFAVVGTRAINLYLSQAKIQPIHTVDWDVVIESNKLSSLKTFANAVISLFKEKGYKIDLIYQSGIGENNLFSFRSRDWIRLTANVCGTKVVMLDIYQVPSFINTMSFIEHEGLLYSDMGFLLRELNRSEHDAKNLLARSSILNKSDIKASLDEFKNKLNESDKLLDKIKDQLDEQIELFGQIDDTLIKSAIRNEIHKIEYVKNTLIRVLKERELLFAAIISGKIDKDEIEPICEACREYEQQYNNYTNLKAQCASIAKMCS